MNIKNACLLLGFSSFAVQGQIPNGGFGSWSMSVGFEEPTGWVTNNAECCVSVTRSSESHSGDFALNVINNGPSFEGPLPGYAMVTFAPVQDANRVGFYARCDSISGTGRGRVEVWGKIAAYFLPIGEWETTSTIGEYNYFEIETAPFLDHDSIRIMIWASAMNDPLGQSTGHADLTVDDLVMDFVMHIGEEEERVRAYLYHDPVSGELQLHDPLMEVQGIDIIDAGGRLVLQRAITETITTIDPGLAPGVHVIRMRHRNGIHASSRTMVLE